MPGQDPNTRDMLMLSGAGTGRGRTVTIVRPLLVTVAVGLFAAGSVADAYPACGAAGSTTLSQSRYARIFVKGDRTYGCMFSRGRAYRLGDKTTNEAFPDVVRLGPVIRLAGRYVGYEIRSAGRDQPNFEVRVLDLSAGRVRRAPESFEEQTEAANRPGGGVTDMILTSRGSVGWIIENVFTDPVRYEVRKADSTTKSRLLDAGGLIEPASLSLTEGRLRWVAEGQVRGAALG